MTSAFVTLFNEINTLLQEIVIFCFGDVILFQLLVDVVFWFTWLWIIYHCFAKPFICCLSFILRFLKNPFFEELEEDE